MDALFARFEELADMDEGLEELVGGKAVSLVNLHRWGLPGSPGGCFTTAALELFLEENELEKQVEKVISGTEEGGKEWEEACGQLKDVIQTGRLPKELEAEIAKLSELFPAARFAVRSSGTREDGKDSSFAGLFESILNVCGAQALGEAIKACWASLFAPRVLTYFRNRKISLDHLGMGLVVQVMVPAEKSGVSFSVNPISGSDTEVVVEACFGLGEGLVSGIVTPDQYIYDWYKELSVHRTVQDKECGVFPIEEPPFTEKRPLPSPQGRAAVLSEEEVADLAHITVRVQAAYGFPVDLEWAIAHGEIFVLQARPITMISFSGIPGEWTTADFKDGGVSSTVCTPLMWSLYECVFEQTMPTYLRSVHLIEDGHDTDWGKMFYGRPYWNVGAVKEGLKRLPGFVERNFDEDLGIEPTYEGPGYVTKTSLRSLLVGLQVLYRLEKSFKGQLRYCEGHRENQEERLEELDRLEYEDWDNQEFFAFYREFIEQDYNCSESSYFNLIYDNSNVSTLFQEGFKKVKGEFCFANMISGLTNLSHLRQTHDLWKIVEAIREEEEATRYWRDTTLEDLVGHWSQGRRAHAMDKVRAHVEAFKHHSTRELDLTVPRFGEDPRLIFQTIRQMLGPVAGSEDPMELARAQERRFEEERERFLDAVPFYRRRSMGKKIERMRAFLWWREELRDLSTRMYYHVRRFTLELEKRLLFSRTLNDEGDIFLLPVEKLCALIDGSLAPVRARSLVKRNRLYYGSFRNYKNPNEIGSRYKTKERNVQEGEVSFNGVPCSPGIVEGRIKVIRDIFDADRLEEGDILVTEFTDPGWTPKFGLLSAVVTETGGMLSHAAVISREYGIPAVLAVDGITALVPEGQHVCVDGNCGRVTVLMQ